MKYTPEITKEISDKYLAEVSVADIAEYLSKYNLDAAGQPQPVPERSVIAKLSSLGIYKKKVYLTKRGETPVKKEEYIERIAEHLSGVLRTPIAPEVLESLEKVTKNVLAMLDKALADPSETS